MIVIKTRMRSLPKSCSRCAYYMLSPYTVYGCPACGAIGGYRGYGKQLGDIKTTKKRAKWCPLSEVQKEKENEI